MIEANVLAAVIERQIRETVDHNIESYVEKTVTQLTLDPAWVSKIEELINQNFAIKFAERLSRMDVSAMIKSEIDQGFESNLDLLLTEFEGKIEQPIQETVTRNLESYVEKTISQLTLDPAWLEKIENLVNQNFAKKFNERISLIDFGELVSSHVDSGFSRYDEALTKKFVKPGVSDIASDVELEVCDDLVRVRNHLVVNSASVEQDLKVRGTLDINNLCVRGSINTDNRSWSELSTVIQRNVQQSLTEEWRQGLTQQVLDLARTQGIDFSEIRIDGATVISGKAISNTITESNLEKTGVLRELTVAGTTKINETLNVNRRRVGINTTDPEMALSIWDEEVSVIAGKIAPQRAFIGTSRMTPLSIGVNRTGYLDIDTDGMITVKKLRIGQHRIAHEAQVPGYSGTRGDIVFNSDPKPGSAFAWVCLGAFKWQPIKGA